MFKDILDSQKITCYELAKRSGISYTAINEIYRGERKLDDCSLKTVKCLALTLCMTLDDFYESSKKREAIPASLYPYFWDTDPTQITLEKNLNYIVTRLLDKGGYEGLTFLKKAVTYEEMKNVAIHSRNISPKIASFLKNIFHLKETDMIFYSKQIKNWKK